MASKRTRNDLTLADKYEAVKLLEQKLSQSAIAGRLGCSQSQVSHISKNRDNIKAEYKSNKNNPGRRRNRTGKAADVEDALTQWLSDVQYTDIYLSGPVLSKKAAELAKKLNKESFNPTNGWLSRWKDRNNLRFKRPKCTTTYTRIVPKTWETDILPNVLKSFQPDDVYNADEIGLNFQALPNGVSTFKTEEGSNNSKQIVTVLLACNMTGTDKRRLLIVGKDQHPKCFQGKKQLPVSYTHSSNGSMTADIFQQWLKDWDTEMAHQKRYILLLVDNCSSHPGDVTSTLTNIRLKLIPPNAISFIQPCNQGIIYNFKGHYRRKLVSKIVDDMVDMTLQTNELPVICKPSLLDAIHLMRRAWGCVKQSTITNCFRKAGVTSMLTDEDSKPDTYSENEIVKPPLGMTAEDFNMYIKQDDDLDCHSVSSEGEIRSPIIIEVQTYDSNSYQEMGNSDIPVSNSEARTALSTLRRFLEENRCEDHHFEQFYQIQDTCEQMIAESTQQINIIYSPNGY